MNDATALTFSMNDSLPAVSCWAAAVISGVTTLRSAVRPLYHFPMLAHELNAVPPEGVKYDNTMRPASDDHGGIAGSSSMGETSCTSHLEVFPVMVGFTSGCRSQVDL